MSEILDSGERRSFDTGAVRDIQENKGRCDLLPLDIITKLLGMGVGEDHDEVIFELNRFINITNDDDELRVTTLLNALIAFNNETDNSVENLILDVSKHFENGAKKYGECNWQLGIPVHSYIDSAIRHYLKWLRGDDDEPHDRAFVWNILCCAWTIRNRPDMNDIVSRQRAIKAAAKDFK